MKLKEVVSWLVGILQRNLIPCLEECCERPLTGKEQQLTSILTEIMPQSCPQGSKKVLGTSLAE
jgi:hypothetical protein